MTYLYRVETEVTATYSVSTRSSRMRCAGRSKPSAGPSMVIGLTRIFSVRPGNLHFGDDIRAVGPARVGR